MTDSLMLFNSLGKKKEGFYTNKKKEVSIILVDKYLNKIKQIADKLYILDRGENAWNGKPSLLTDQIVKKYLSV